VCIACACACVRVRVHVHVHEHVHVLALCPVVRKGAKVIYRIVCACLPAVSSNVCFLHTCPPDHDTTMNKQVKKYANDPEGMKKLIEEFKDKV